MAGCGGWLVWGGRGAWLSVPRVSCTAVRGAGHNKWSNIKHIKAERDGQLAKVSRLLDHTITFNHVFNFFYTEIRPVLEQNCTRHGFF